MHKYLKIQRFWTVIFFVLAGGIFSVSAQTDEPAARSIVSLDFQSQRKPSEQKAKVKLNSKSNTNRQKAVAAISGARRRYNLTKRVPVRKGKSVKTAVKPKIEELGVTFWRMRQTTAADADAPLFPVRIGDRTEKWTAERVPSTTVFKTGDRVRFTVESSRNGFLYIVNREFYTDGTTGNANVIFPTTRTRGGNNRVSAGSLIEIPGANDSVPYFTIKPRRADYAGEELIVLILPNPLPDFEISVRPQSVASENLAKWFADWETLVDVYDAEDGAGTAYTEDEASAANSTTRDLTQEEPLPQTIFRVSLKPNAPVFVAFRMNAE